jgi:hypothetical protein
MGTRKASLAIVALALSFVPSACGGRIPWTRFERSDEVIAALTPYVSIGITRADAERALAGVPGLTCYPYYAVEQVVRCRTPARSEGCMVSSHWAIEAKFEHDHLSALTARREWDGP